MSERDGVIVVGAGPVGLVTALGLARSGVPVTLIEKEPALTRDLRAGSFHPPTLELMEPLGITPRLLEIAIRVPVWQMRDRQEGLVAEFDLSLLKNDTPYPFRAHCEQFKLTPIVLDLLKQQSNVEVHFDTEFVGFEQTGDHVDVTVRGPGGERVLRGSFLVAGDGGRSAVRKATGIEFEGFTWPERFLVISTYHDLGEYGFAPNAYIADPDEWAAVFKMPGEEGRGLWRLAVPIPTEMDDEVVLSEEYAGKTLSGLLRHEADFPIAYRSVYRVHQRVAKHFRLGRVVLAGDAAHVNNPLGGFGLNSGIHDACNLYPKLARVWRGEAPQSELDLYSRQRRTATVDFVQAQSIRNKRTLEERDPEVRRQRREELREIAADPQKAYEYLLNTSMINSLRKANATL